jgi:uncharacterized membrane protein
MIDDIKNYLKGYYNTIIHSIAFYPVIIATLFSLFAAGLILFDFSDTALEIKKQYDFLSIKDPTTARSILNAIATGLISLTVFSFSMVMVVLNQAASNMSNRVLNNLIGNRFQQIVLGIYIGTIVFAFFLLTTIRDLDKGMSIPSLSIYTLMLLTIIDIFLFIYFIHYITQSVKYDVIVKRILNETRESLEEVCTADEDKIDVDPDFEDVIIEAGKSGVYEGYHSQNLKKIVDENQCKLAFLYPKGYFVLEGTPIIKVNKQLDEDLQKKIRRSLYLVKNESINGNYFYGFRQLKEIAIKALSPGINDPGTAVESLNAITELLAYRLQKHTDREIKTENGGVIYERGYTFEDLVKYTLWPVWDYGKEDRLMQDTFINLIDQLSHIQSHDSLAELRYVVKNKIDTEREVASK